MKAIIVSQLHWDLLPLEISKKIIETSKEGYGVKFISRETGEEESDNSIIGLFGIAIREAMEKIV